MTTLRTYSPAGVSLVLAAYEVEGFSEDSIISINKDDRFFQTAVGATGYVERTHRPSSTYTLQVTLSQTSPSNTFISSLATLDNLSRYAAIPLFIKDSSGDTVFFAGSSWVEDEPEVSFTNGLEDRTWEIKCSDVVTTIGGNGDVGDIEELSKILNLIDGVKGFFD